MLKVCVTKSITLETAHQLKSSYAKECQNIHGHSYKCEITLEGPLNEDGMVMDFKKMKEKILEPIKEKYDHQFITSETLGGKNPTAENMAQDIFDMAQKEARFLLKGIRLWETATCYVEVGY